MRECPGQGNYKSDSISAYQASNKLQLFPLVYLFGILHLVGLLGLILFPPGWGEIFIILVLANFFGLGITLGYHRLFTHRAFHFKSKWMERILATIGVLNVQHGPIWWSSIHRLHHKYSDTQLDPHDSQRGLFYSHMGWLFYLDPRYKVWGVGHKYPSNVKDLSSDPYYRWLHRYWLIPFFIYTALLWALGGVSWVIWGGVIPVLYNLHVTWSVNSLAHFFGYRSFKTRPATDLSKNNLLVGLLALGEGWHNNHHAFPASARHGFFSWWEFDLTYLVVKIFHQLGLVTGIKPVSKEQIEKVTLPKESRSLSFPPAKIVVRHRHHPFDNNIAKFYDSDNPVLTHEWHALSFMIPPGERFFVRSVKRMAHYAQNPILKSQIRAFIAQEQMHSKETDRSLSHLVERGFPVREFQKNFEKHLFFMEKFKFLNKVHVATTAGLEHFTASLALWNFNANYSARFPKELNEVWRWHGLEEIEHRAVAFDLLQEVAPRNYPLRILGFVWGFATAWVFYHRAQRRLLKWDGLKRKEIRQARKEARRQRISLMSLRIPHLLSYLRPGFHPNDVDASNVRSINLPQPRESGGLKVQEIGV